MTEVEAQAIGCNEGAFLRDMRSEYAFECGMQKMRRRMVCAGRAPLLAIDGKIDGVVQPERALRHLDDMHVKAAEFLLGVDDLAFGRRRPDRSLIADLAARFRIERGLVGEEADGLPGACALHALAFGKYGDDF